MLVKQIFRTRTCWNTLLRTRTCKAVHFFRIFETYPTAKIIHIWILNNWSKTWIGEHTFVRNRLKVVEIWYQNAPTCIGWVHYFLKEKWKHPFFWIALGWVKWYFNCVHFLEGCDHSIEKHLKDAVKNKRDGKKSRFFTKSFKTLTYSIFTSFKVTTMIHGANRIYLFVEISWRALYERARTCARAARSYS